MLEEEHKLPPASQMIRNIATDHWKSLKAWKIERWMIHSVLAFSIIMTVVSLYTMFTGVWQVFGVETSTIQKTYGFLIGSVFSGVVGTGFYPLMGNRMWCRFGCPLAAYLGLVQRYKSRFRITPKVLNKNKFNFFRANI